MKIAIAICTYNRAELLRTTLECLCGMDAPQAAEWAVLVVNNRSTDHTDAVIAQFAQRLPLVPLQEPQQGLSHARNRAVKAAEQWGADYILWTDDDVLPCREWLRAYEQAFTEAPQARIFGGSVDPLFEEEPPRWLTKHFPFIQSAFAVIDPYVGSQPAQSNDIRDTGLPYGANFALGVRGAVPIHFDARLGVKGGQRMLGEETALMSEMVKQGATGRWIAQARVQHRVPAERMRLRYVGEYNRGVGRTAAVVDDTQGAPWRKRWTFRAAIVRSLSALAYLVIDRDISGRFLQSYVQANRDWGYFIQ